MDENLHHNPADGQLYKGFADILLSKHVLVKAAQPLIYLDRIAKYYETALPLLPEYSDEILYSLATVYAELGDAQKAEERWGVGVVEQVSFDMKKAFPNTEGFSVANLWFMKKWYLFYTQNAQILHQPGAESPSRKKLQRPVGEIQNRQKLYQVGREFPQQFALVPWRHHIEIITKCKTVKEALFYIGKVIEQGMSRNALVNCIKANLFKHQGKIENNFTEKLPALHSSLVQEVLKENYDFGFATVSHEIYDEAELENALTENVTNLLLEMGTGFAFVGRQKEITVNGRSRKIDLLFYHIRLRCYIACELKARPLVTADSKIKTAVAPEPLTKSAPFGLSAGMGLVKTL